MGLVKCNSSAPNLDLRAGLDAPSAWTLVSSHTMRGYGPITDSLTKEGVCYGNNWRMERFSRGFKISLEAPEGGWSEEGYRYFFKLNHSRNSFKPIIEEGVVQGNETRDIVIPPTLAAKLNSSNYINALHIYCRLYILVPRRVMQNYSASILSGMLRMHTLGCPSLDLTLKTTSGEVKVHSCVFNEAQSTKYVEGDTIDVPNVRIEVLKDLVEYCYVREVSTKMVRTHPLETILLAQHLKVLPLVNTMISLLPLIVTSTNALDLMMKSSGCSRDISEPIQAYTLDFIQHNLKDFNNDTLVRELPKEKLALLVKKEILNSKT